MEKLSEFNFKVQYVAGEENVLPDALLRLYEYDEPGTIRAPGEYLQYDAEVETSTQTEGSVLSTLLYIGMEALAISPRQSSCLQQQATDEMSPEVPSVPTPTPSRSVKRTTPPAPLGTAGTTRAQPRQRAPPPPAETGQPETGAKFAA